MRSFLLVAATLALLVGAARADDPPSTPPVPERVVPKPTRLAPAPEVPGIHWERDFKSALRRAAAEGRPIFVAVNALEDQPGGNFPSRAEGDASRPYVCFVANGEDHATTRLPDGTEICSRYGSGTCACHKEALVYALAKFSSDGETVVSPSHGILDPDGGIAFHGDFIQSAPQPAQFDEIAVRVSPRLMTRLVWTAREDRMSALGKAVTAGLLDLAAAWIGSGDALAPAGLAATLELETDLDRRAALAAALRGAGARASHVVFDAIDEVSGRPDRDPVETLRWVGIAAAVDPDLSAYAVARVIVRTKDAALRAKALATAAGAAPGTEVDVPNLPEPLRTRVLEAYVLRGDRGSAEGLAKGLLPVSRLTRARRAVGAGPAAAPIGPSLAALSRDEARSALLAASAFTIRANHEATALLLGHGAAEVRIAAAVALRRIGDPAGATLLLAALADPVEGPETHEALVAVAGEDFGEEASAWESWLRDATGGGK